MKRFSSGFLLFLGVGTLLLGQTSNTPTIAGISNAASGAVNIESGSWLSIYGTNLSTATRSWQSSDFVGNALPTTIDNVTVTIDGKKSAISYVSPAQLNVQAPTDSAVGPVAVVVTSPNGTVTSSLTLQNYSPGFFELQGKYAAARHNSDGSVVAPAGFLGTAVPSHPATPGESISIYATGLGPTTPAVPAGQLFSTPEPIVPLSALQVTIGGAAATLQYAGIVGPGEYQINLIVPQSEDGDQTIQATIGGVSTQAQLLIPIQNSVTGTVSVSLSPNNKALTVGSTLALSFKVNNTSNQIVAWQVNGIAGGNASVGTVSAAGVYTAPLMLPSTPAITVTAISQEQASAQASVTIDLQNAAPVVTAVTPTTLNPGAANIVVNGTGFANGAVIYLAGVAQPTTVVSNTQLTTATTVVMPVGRLAAVKVTNPTPGGGTSVPVAVPVRVATEMVDYADAVRFLQMTTWGPAPQDVVNVQTMGESAWLAAQFAQTPSTWPDPTSTTESYTSLQPSFWSVTLTGSDQLRQRMAMALGEIMVVSGIKDTTYEQMVSYQRVLAQYAFDTYRNLFNAVTLNPGMGDYLDMVNNMKATATTAPNENYARESMQLFSLGLVQLNSTGAPVIVNGATVPEYDQTTVSTMAKILTGWTYGETPGFQSVWTNMPYYFSPMLAFETYHDTTAKTLNLPIPCTIAAGGAAESDMAAAYDCVFQQTNVAPMTAFELIQHFVMSSPPSDYVGRVTAAFQMSGGSLTNTITAILNDPEAQTPATGKLTEPILYTTNLLRALGATITSPASLTTLSSNMGQTPLAPPTVFSFFAPGYVIPNFTPTTLAPEFQTLNATTALARANFAWDAVTNAISGVTVNMANLTDLANNPADLVEAINQALFRGQMTSDVRGILTTAASTSTNLTSRVHSAFYAAAASPQYAVQQ